MWVERDSVSESARGVVERFRFGVSKHEYAGFVPCRPQGLRQANCVAIRLSGKHSAAVDDRRSGSGPLSGFGETGEQFALGPLHRLGCRQIGL